MKGWKDFSYSAEQWDRIAACVVKLRGVDDTHRIPKGGGPSPRSLIEVAAGVFCSQGWINRREAESQARFDKMIGLRDAARNLRDSIATEIGFLSGLDANMLNALDAYIDKLTRKIDFMLLPPISISAPRVEPTSNASKTWREEFWSKLLAIWIEFGGKETGAEAARFLMVASKPAFDFVRGDADASDKDRAIPSKKSVEQWLLRRRATR